MNTSVWQHGPGTHTSEGQSSPELRLLTGVGKMHGSTVEMLGSDLHTAIESEAQCPETDEDWWEEAESHQAGEGRARRKRGGAWRRKTGRVQAA